MKKKFRIFGSVAREEAWLEKELQKGHVLVKADGYGTYTFSDETPIGKIHRRSVGVGPNMQDYVIRIDCRKFQNRQEYEEYCSFLSEFGWTGIKSNKKSGKIYFIGKKSDANELFSDVESTHKRDIRSRNDLVKISAFILALYFIFFFDLSIILHPIKTIQEASTPNTFGMQGTQIIKTVLLDIPLVTFLLLITYVPIILLSILFYQLIISQKAINAYKN